MPLRPDVTLDALNRRGDGRLPGLVGFRVVELHDGLLVAELDIRAELLAPNGYLHAATVVALADTACGFGCIAHLPLGAENFTTVELKANFFSTARDGVIVAIARPVHMGNTTQVWDAEVKRKADDRQIALFRCTQLVLWPKKAD
jgi:1,4-dihydroxy-2-naphthoyl-CoA hydrolase